MRHQVPVELPAGDETALRWYWPLPIPVHDAVLCVLRDVLKVLLFHCHENNNGLWDSLVLLQPRLEEECHTCSPVDLSETEAGKGLCPGSDPERDSESRSRRPLCLVAKLRRNGVVIRLRRPRLQRCLRRSEFRVGADEYGFLDRRLPVCLGFDPSG